MRAKTLPSDLGSARKRSTPKDLADWAGGSMTENACPGLGGVRLARSGWSAKAAATRGTRAWHLAHPFQTEAVDEAQTPLML